jgi:hypothetical protein
MRVNLRARNQDRQVRWWLEKKVPQAPKADISFAVIHKLAPLGLGRQPLRSFMNNCETDISLRGRDLTSTRYEVLGNDRTAAGPFSTQPSGPRHAETSSRR